jgi:hypothetical protein
LFSELLFDESLIDEPFLDLIPSPPGIERMMDDWHWDDSPTLEQDDPGSVDDPWRELYALV